MTAKIYLTTTQAESGDSILEMTGSGPAFIGDDVDESLACGSCKSVIAKHFSTASFAAKFKVPKRLLLACRCGAHNVIPATISPAP